MWEKKNNVPVRKSTWGFFWRKKHIEIIYRNVGHQSSGKGRVLDLLGKYRTSWAKVSLPTPDLTCPVLPPPAAPLTHTPHLHPALCSSHSGTFNMPACSVLFLCSPSHLQELLVNPLKSSSIVSCLSPSRQTVKEESLTLPAVNPIVTPQKSGSSLDASLHKDLFGAISGIGNARTLTCFSAV